MQQITIDTSALVVVITNEASKGKIIEITKHCSLCAPHSVHWEIGNAFSAMFKRQRLTFDVAKQCLAAYQKIPIKFIDAPLERTLELCQQFNMYAYDAYLVQCAQQTSTSLLTLDRGLKSVAQAIGIVVHEVD